VPEKFPAAAPRAGHATVPALRIAIIAVVLRKLAARAGVARARRIPSRLRPTWTLNADLRQSLRSAAPRNDEGILFPGLKISGLMLGNRNAKSGAV
jgi:hypothetical protein